jgi:hypothetical protein
MAERLALKITRNLRQDRFEQELWNLAAIIEEHLLSEMVQLDKAERRSEETEPWWHNWTKPLTVRLVRRLQKRSDGA